jgi:predicted NBD/HSP70 family sugar kinase
MAEAPVEKLFSGTHETILKTIRDQQPISRAKIAQYTRISKPAVSEIVARLIQKGAVEECEFGCSTRRGGKKPRLLSFRPGFRYVIAIDIGGTNIRTVLSDLDGTFLKRIENSTRSIHTEEDLLKRISESIDALGGVPNEKILGIGIGLPGTVDPESGTVQYIPSFRLRKIALSRKIQKITSFPTFIANDVTLNALGELWKGSARGAKNIILVSLGTGTGSGIIINGQVYEGAHGYAGEIGYQVTDWKLERSVNQTSMFGPLENWFSGFYLENKLEKLGLEMTLASFFEQSKTVPEFLDILKGAIEHLTLAISNAVVMFDPEHVILTGGIGYHQYERIIALMMPTLEQTVPEEILRNVTFCKGILGKDGVLIGAISYVQRKALMET